MLSSNDWTLLIRWGCFASVSHRAVLGHAQCPTSKQPFLPLCGISHSHLLFQLHSQAQKPSTADRPRKAQGELQSSCWLRCAFALRTGGHTEGAGSAGRTWVQHRLATCLQDPQTGISPFLPCPPIKLGKRHILMTVHQNVHSLLI